MSKIKHERLMRIKEKVGFENIRFLRDEFGTERISMNSLFMDLVELMLDDLLKKYDYKLSRCASSLNISSKTLYRKLHKKKKGNNRKIN